MLKFFALRAAARRSVAKVESAIGDGFTTGSLRVSQECDRHVECARADFARDAAICFGVTRDRATAAFDRAHERVLRNLRETAYRTNVEAARQRLA